MHFFISTFLTTLPTICSLGFQAPDSCPPPSLFYSVFPLFLPSHCLASSLVKLTECAVACQSVSESPCGIALPQRELAKKAFWIGLLIFSVHTPHLNYPFYHQLQIWTWKKIPSSSAFPQHSYSDLSFPSVSRHSYRLTLARIPWLSTLTSLLLFAGK